VADDKTVWLFEIGELGSFRFKIISKFRDSALLEAAFYLLTQDINQLLQLSTFFATFLALLALESQLYLSDVIFKAYFLTITEEAYLFDFLKNSLNKGNLFSFKTCPLLLSALTLG